jgi:hypothetical protein
MVVIDADVLKLVKKFIDAGGKDPGFKLGQRRLSCSGDGLERWKRPREVKCSKYMFGWVAGEQVFDYVY